MKTPFTLIATTLCVTLTGVTIRAEDQKACTGTHADCSESCGDHGGSNYKCTVVGAKEQYLSGGGEESNFYTAISKGGFCANRFDGPNCDQNNNGHCGPEADLACTTGPTE